MSRVDAPVVGERIPPLHRNRDFLLLWSGSAVSMLGSTASLVAYPLLVLALTGSPGAAGLAGFVALLPTLLFQLPAGALVDRWDRKRVMIWCDVLRALGVGSIVAAIAVDELHLWHVLAVGFVEGTLSVGYELAAGAAIPNVVHPSQVTTALSRNEARERAAVMAGTPLGGALFGLGRIWPFVLDTVSYLVSLLTLLFIRRDFQATPGDATDPDARPGKLAAELTHGLRWLWGQPFLRTATLLVAGSNLLFRVLFLIIIVAFEAAGAAPAAIGLLLGVAGTSGVLGSLVATWCAGRFPMRAIVIAANWVWALMTCVIALTDDRYLIGAAYALMWFVGPIWNVAVAGYQMALTPDHIQGRVLSAVSLLANGAVALGSLAGGYLLESLGPAHAAWSMAVWMVLLAALATLSRSIRRASFLPIEPPRRS
ncbi:putative MFS family arabinose efflux permease [Micromonospora sp. M71_S20]|uniref:MFS transporter n=1 Tax=Micromonospora sp. M71_S20 TaxID=592872 RepID=UPI000EAD9201|nr:MFS transporter [Micromonospora sp. M71_S20]RLK09864.1 putative MFS family arabinose efflux permease [Micromonospora sp. M71_S20]